MAEAGLRKGCCHGLYIHAGDLLAIFSMEQGRNVLEELIRGTVGRPPVNLGISAFLPIRWVLCLPIVKARTPSSIPFFLILKKRGSPRLTHPLKETQHHVHSRTPLANHRIRS